MVLKMIDDNSELTGSVIEAFEIETSIGTFVCGTISGKCCLFEFKDRKALPDIMKRQNKRYSLKYGDTKNELHYQIEKEILSYLDGTLTEFTIPLHLIGTKFQKEVWSELLKIPYGETISYGEIARRIGNPKAMRAVGAANGKNSIPIIIPCHRVINADGHLHGYGGGIWRKKKLLQLEIDVIKNSSQSSLNEWYK